MGIFITTFPYLGKCCVWSASPPRVGGGGGPTTKKTKNILRFSRRHDLFCSFFCSLFEDILLTKSGKKNKKDQKRSKNTKIMIFFVLF